MISRRTTRWRALAFVTTASLVTVAVACSDSTHSVSAPTGPFDDVTPPMTATSALWRADGSRLTLISTPRVQIAGGVSTGPEGIEVDTAMALRMRAEFAQASNLSTALLGDPPQPYAGSSGMGATFYSSPASSQRTHLRSHRVLVKASDGTEVRLEIVPDANVNKPPVAVATFIKNRLSNIQQTQYEQVSGRWKVKRTRLSLFDSTGKLAFVQDNDFGTMAIGSARPSSLRNLRRLSGSWLPNILALVQPDELYAETVTSKDDDTACLNEGIEAGLAAANEVRSGAALVAAYAGVAAAAAGLTAAEESCVEIGPLCIAAITAANLAITAAGAALLSAQFDLTVSTAAAAYCAKKLADCLAPQWVQKLFAGTGSGGEGDVGGDELISTSCDFWVYEDYAGNILAIDDPNGCFL